jgi:hypothetical protein
MPIPFNCKWPAKVLRDRFKSRFVPEPEFKPLDLQGLRPEDPSGLNHLTKSDELLTTKGESCVSNRKNSAL